MRLINTSNKHDHRPYNRNTSILTALEQRVAKGTDYRGTDSIKTAFDTAKQPKAPQPHLEFAWDEGSVLI